MSAWKLIMAGRFEEAVDLLSREIAGQPSTALHNNRGMALLHLGEFQQALSDFRAAEEFSIRQVGGERDGDLCGVALWMAGQHQEAAAVWTRGTELTLEGAVTYVDRAGGVTIGNLLWFASVRLHDPARRELATQLLRTKQSRVWPGTISSFLLGEMNESTLRAATSQTPFLRERELCQAAFYIGVSVFDSDRPRYYGSMQRAAELGAVSKLEAEYYLAMYESSQEGRSSAA